LLHARTAEAVAGQLEGHASAILKRAETATAAEKSAQWRIQSEGLRAETESHRYSVQKLHQQGDAAAVKLAYLLGLNPCDSLMPIDDRLQPVMLVDASPPACDLVAQAMSNGPGIRELEGLLRVVQDGLDRSKGCMVWMPTLEMRMAEGAFGAGPGDSMLWDNRWDLALQARWNLTEFLVGRERQRMAESKLNQLQLTQQDLRGKLAAGVLEARDATLSGQEQIRMASQQIRYAQETYQLAYTRMLQGKTIENPTSEAQVYQALRSLEMAHIRYLEAVSAFDKAQLRLLVFMGAASCCTPAPAARPAAVPAAPAIPETPKSTSIQTLPPALNAGRQ
jgi:outer membrane protein TolC